MKEEKIRAEFEFDYKHLDNEYLAYKACYKAAEEQLEEANKEIDRLRHRIKCLEKRLAWCYG